MGLRFNWQQAAFCRQGKPTITWNIVARPRVFQPPLQPQMMHNTCRNSAADGNAQPPAEVAAHPERRLCLLSFSSHCSGVTVLPNMTHIQQDQLTWQSGRSAVLATLASKQGDLSTPQQQTIRLPTHPGAVWPRSPPATAPGPQSCPTCSAHRPPAPGAPFGALPHPSGSPLPACTPLQACFLHGNMALGAATSSPLCPHSMLPWL